jgi:hypothetical protein
MLRVLPNIKLAGSPPKERVSAAGLDSEPVLTTAPIRFPATLADRLYLTIGRSEER